MTALVHLGSPTVTIAAIVLAAVCAGIAWRTVRAARRQSEQRVAALAAAIHDAGDAPEPATPLAPPARQRRRAAPVMASLAAGVVLTAVAGIALWAAVRPATPAAPDREPLELAALQHGVRASAFTVSGEVAVPDGRSVPGLAVELVTLDREGHAIASSGAPVALSIGTPRRRVPFSVSVPYSSPVDRYTIRFRDASGLRPHLDRRRGQTAP